MITPALCSFGFLEMQVLGMYARAQQIQREAFLYNGDMPECTCKHTVTAVHTCVFIQSMYTPAVDRPIYDYINLTIKSVGI